MLRRRTLLKAAVGAAALGGVSRSMVHSADQAAASRGVSLAGSLPGEDTFTYLRRTAGGFDELGAPRFPFRFFEWEVGSSFRAKCRTALDLR